MNISSVWSDGVMGKDGLVGRYIAKSTDLRRARWAAMRGWLNRARIGERRAALIDLEQAAAAAPTIDRAVGIAALQPGTLPEVDGVVRETRQALANAAARAASRKAQLLTGFVDPASLTIESSFLRFALRREVVACAARYLGLVPILGAVDCWYSQASPASTNSQLFHCDWTDLMQVRIYVHASDVTVDDGPLVAVDATRSAQLRERFGYRYGAALTDAEIATIVDDRHWHVLTGATGYVSLVDTSRCFHQGSRIRLDGRSRMVAMLQFVTPTAFFLPARRAGGPPFSRLATNAMPRWQRLVLGSE